MIVFARAPVAGRVKTRLVPRLGEWGAARLHARLTAQALRTARAAGCGPVELHTTERHSQLKGARLQRGAGLGERMKHALTLALRRHRGAIIIGADCPALRVGDVLRAARLLAGGNDLVLAPAEDGGYVLIGARRIVPEVFSGIPWGTPSVYEATVERLARHRWRALRRLWDVDRPQDLERLRSLRFSSAHSPRARR